MNSRPRKRTDPSGDPERLPDQKRMEQVRIFAACYQYEKEHSEQVTRLALQLFDRLRPLHRLNAQDRFLLECAAVLHDIGWIEGQQKHHKTTLRMILQDTTLPLTIAERNLAGLVARYHRKALPRPDHPLYHELNKQDRFRVDMLGGILRVADGLDRTHMNIVEQVDVRITDHQVILQCHTKGPALPEITEAREKAALLERAAGRQIMICNV